jgi:hypothetical protein
MTPEQLEAWKSGFHRIPTVGLRDVDSVSMTAEDVEALEKTTTTPHIIKALRMAALSIAACPALGLDDDDASGLPAYAGPSKVFAAGTRVGVFHQHRTMAGVVTSYADGVYGVDVTGSTKITTYRVHHSFVHDAEPVADGGAASSRHRLHRRCNDPNPDQLDPYALKHRHYFEPSEHLATAVTPAHSKHVTATAAMRQADDAATREFDPDPASWTLSSCRP